jgi:hypothetical protein
VYVLPGAISPEDANIHAFKYNKYVVSVRNKQKLTFQITSHLNDQNVLPNTKLSLFFPVHIAVR